MKAKTPHQLHMEFVERLNASKPAFRRMFAEDVMGVTAIVGDADPLTGKMLRTGPKYTMRGMGCGITIVTPKGVKGKKYEAAVGDAIRDFRDQMEAEMKALYPGEEIGPLMTQDSNVNAFIARELEKWYSDNGIKVNYQTFDN